MAFAAGICYNKSRTSRRHRCPAEHRAAVRILLPNNRNEDETVKKTYMIMDMGTSNTRLWLYAGEEMLAADAAPFGAGSSREKGKDYLFGSLRELIGRLLEEGGVSSADVEQIFVSGMAGSEIGLCDVPHIALPADIYTLADHLAVRTLPEITDIPFVFVPGLKQMKGELFDDIMRGEETETAGILSAAGITGDAVLLLPGTHNKVIEVRDGAITSFRTTFSGELLNGIISHSILSGQVSHHFAVKDAAVLQGAAYAAENGLNAALFHIRVMAKNGRDTDHLSSFLYGAVLGEDIALIRRIAAGRPVYIGGRDSLRHVYSLLLGEDAMPLSEEAASGAVRRGLMQIRKLHHARLRREEVIAAVEREKLITIIRKPDPAAFGRAMQALYDGGVRLAEITFDRGGEFPKEQTAALIRQLCEQFDGRMLVGAGTVTTEEDVRMACEAGASFIISPNCDSKVIALSRKLGLVSMPAAFTPTEIAAAVQYGADYIKLFPVDELSGGYARAVKAPLSDVKLLAVGGITLENAGKYISLGFSGVGVGTSLYNKKLIEAGDWDGLTALAAKYTEAVKG